MVIVIICQYTTIITLYGLNTDVIAIGVIALDDASNDAAKFLSSNKKFQLSRILFTKPHVKLKKKI